MLAKLGDFGHFRAILRYNTFMIRFREREAGESSSALLYLPHDVNSFRGLHVVMPRIEAGGPSIVVRINPDLLEHDVRTPSERENVPIEETHALVLAGGIASRMKNSDPKQLIPITLSRRLIDFSMDMLANAGIQGVTFSCVRYTVDPIVRHVGRNAEVNPIYGKSRFFVKEEPEGVIPAIRDPIEGFNMRDKPLIIVHGDEVLYADLRKMYEYHTSNHNPITACMIDDPMSKNTVFLQTDEDARVVRVGRYPNDVTLSSASAFGYRYTLTGLWIIDPDYIDFLKSSKSADSFIFEVCKEGLLYGYRNTGLFFNCNTPEDIETTRRALEQSSHG